MSPSVMRWSWFILFCMKNVWQIGICVPPTYGAFSVSLVWRTDEGIKAAEDVKPDGRSQRLPVLSEWTGTDHKRQEAPMNVKLRRQMTGGRWSSRRYDDLPPLAVSLFHLSCDPEIFHNDTRCHTRSAADYNLDRGTRMNTFILELLIQHLLAGRTDGDCKHESSRLDWKHMRRWQTVYEILECKGSLTADNLVIIWASGETWSKLHHEWLNSELYWFKLVMTNESCAMCSVV